MVFLLPFLQLLFVLCVAQVLGKLGIGCIGRMSSLESMAGDNGSWDNGSWDKLLSYLRGLDWCQLEEFKLGLQSPQWLPSGSQKIPWANVKAANPADLLCLMNEHFPGRQVWDVTLRIFENMSLTSLCEELRAEMNGEWGLEGWGRGRMETWRDEYGGEHRGMGTWGDGDTGSMGG